MHISINNSLPSVSIQLGLRMGEDNDIRMLVDTGAAMKSGYLDYHFWVMSQYSEMVVEFLQCGENTNYDVVQLLAVLDLNLGQLPNNHVQMTAII